MFLVFPLKPVVPVMAGLCAGFLVLATAAAHAGEEQPLTLEQALAWVQENNEIPEIAAARVDRAGALLQEAYGALLPSLTATATYSRRQHEVTRELAGEEAVIQARDALAGNLQADVDLFNPAAVPAVRGLRRGREAAELEANELRRLLGFETARSFFSVLSVERLHDAAERRAAIARQTLDETEQRFEAGLASRNDVTRSELEAATAEFQVTETANLVRQARLALGYLLDVEVTQPLEEPPFTETAQAEIGEWERAALAGREDLQARLARAEAARLQAQAPWLAYLPVLSLTGTYRGTNETGFGGHSTDWTLATVLRWTLFDGGVNRARAAARRAEYREEGLQAAALRRRIAVEVREVLAEIHTAEAALRQAEVRVRVAERNTEEVRLRFNQGLATALEQADATASEFEAASELARQRFALHTAQLGLVETLGRWPSDESDGEER